MINKQDRKLETKDGKVYFIIASHAYDTNVKENTYGRNILQVEEEVRDQKCPYFAAEYDEKEFGEVDRNVIMRHEAITYKTPKGVEIPCYTFTRQNYPEDVRKWKVDILKRKGLIEHVDTTFFGDVWIDIKVPARIVTIPEHDRQVRVSYDCWNDLFIDEDARMDICRECGTRFEHQ